MEDAGGVGLVCSLFCVVSYLVDRASKLCLKETLNSVSLDILQITNGLKKKLL